MQACFAIAAIHASAIAGFAHAGLLLALVLVLLLHAPGMMGMPSLKWSDSKNLCTMWFD
jgi:hypothetical protein